MSGSLKLPKTGIWKFPNISGYGCFWTLDMQKLAWSPEASLMVLMESNRGNRVQVIKEIVLINDLHQQAENRERSRLPKIKLRLF